LRNKHATKVANAKRDGDWVFARTKAARGPFRANRVTLTARRLLPVFLEAHQVNGLLRRSSESNRNGEPKLSILSKWV
jgi:hypothetical protein